MTFSHIEFERISPEARLNIQKKFRSAYTQEELQNMHAYFLPVFVRWNNRNVYGNIYYNGASFFVSNFYRIKRDGTPVRLYVGLDYTQVLIDGLA